MQSHIRYIQDGWLLESTIEGLGGLKRLHTPPGLSEQSVVDLQRVATENVVACLHGDIPANLLNNEGLKRSKIRIRE